MERGRGNDGTGKMVKNNEDEREEEAWMDKKDTNNTKIKRLSHIKHTLIHLHIHIHVHLQTRTKKYEHTNTLS